MILKVFKNCFNQYQLNLMAKTFGVFVIHKKCRLKKLIYVDSTNIIINIISCKSTHFCAYKQISIILYAYPGVSLCECVYCWK